MTDLPAQAFPIKSSQYFLLIIRNILSSNCTKRQSVGVWYRRTQRWTPDYSTGVVLHRAKESGRIRIVTAS